jgi:hypothetical protein
VSGVVIANNIFWNNEFDFGDEPRPAQVLSSLTAAPGYAGVNGNISGDPRFIDPAAGDYRLQPGSPAARSGSTPDMPFEDIECRPRSSPPDMGAYESGTGGGCGAEGSNFTALWWNPRESGWGVNLNHQGAALFATLFTYARDGRNMWLVGSNLVQQPDGSFSGELHRATGPAFNRTPWMPGVLSPVGSMTLRFPSSVAGALSYTVDGTEVTKVIQKFAFAIPVPKCSAVAGSRSAQSNYQDLWWNPQESGWGINFTHQGNTLFATLFTYDAAGRDLWLVASNLARRDDGSFTGELHSVRGPAFNASPWTPVMPARVGDMTVRFANGENGTLAYSYEGIAVSKQITRYAFGTTAPACF